MLAFRVGEAYRRAKRRLNETLPRKTKRDNQRELEGMKPILPYELGQFIGLLVARAIAPNREKLTNHRKTTDEAAISRGRFGSVLARDRVLEISRNLHFNPNSDPRSRTDRAWRYESYATKPICIQQDARLLEGQAPQVGHKLFMLCSAVTAYRIRFEVYCGKKQHASDAHKTDMKSGPAAVVRNFAGSVSDSVVAHGLLLRWNDHDKPPGILQSCRGEEENPPTWNHPWILQMAKSKLVPNMTAISWWGSRPVHFLFSGGCLKMDCVTRQDGAAQMEVACPRVIKD
ncbi:hypothetical protein PC110_g8050 [Phytophthora cactorum]|uniref:PiggyBac transposable element-derived protein domain-containing protein n=2 Tax=Phytophthora cactorum TaxID=29920 RepID=A0A329SFN2_9STRA|nr:hypothetical protein PC110_g8050 [Phytophthora cactorum]